MLLHLKCCCPLSSCELFMYSLLLEFKIKSVKLKREERGFLFSGSTGIQVFLHFGGLNGTHCLCGFSLVY